MNIQSIERGIPYTTRDNTCKVADVFQMPVDTAEIGGRAEPSGLTYADTIKAFFRQFPTPLAQIGTSVQIGTSAPVTAVNNGASITAQKPLVIDSAITHNCTVPFLAHHGAAPMSTTLAMNIEYEPVKSLRKPIEDTIGRKLDFLTMWDAQGEAHITTITPVEFDKYLKPYVSAQEMESIARKMDIQGSDIRINGIGSGKAVIDNKEEETFFIIVDSDKLKDIRKAVYDMYAERVSAQGKEPEWNYREFYPHITIGYTKRDLHIQDGVIKDAAHSLDRRFPHVISHGQDR